MPSSVVGHTRVMERRFAQLDVFSDRVGAGNPLAVVVDGDGLDDENMQRFANWTNLSETTFLVPPTDRAANYRVRIFTPTMELPFAGHPTLGSCRAWLDSGGVAAGDEIVQECGAGLVSIRERHGRLAFAAPPLLRSGPVDEALQARVAVIAGTTPIEVVWADNGPGWVVALLPSVEDVLEMDPEFGGATDLDLGVVAFGPGDGANVEVRAFFPGPDGMREDPVTGSLNASLAQWLMERDPDLRSYVARQGTRLGRRGLVYLDRDDDGTVWVGGDVTTAVRGTLTL